MPLTGTEDFLLCWLSDDMAGRVVISVFWGSSTGSPAGTKGKYVAFHVGNSVLMNQVKKGRT